MKLLRIRKSWLKSRRWQRRINLVLAAGYTLEVR
jgi:hypothetical protein